MQLLRLRVFHYRNLDQQEVELSPGTNLFFGLNGQGKTNLLESIYILGFGKSFRTPKPKECIRHGETESAVEGTVSHRGISRDLQVVITSSEKRLSVHGKVVPVDEFVGLFQVVAFTSSHLGIVRGSPAERRAFLDRAMVPLFPGHLHLLASYGRALKHRNRILSEARESSGTVDAALLDSWDETIARDGARILSNRLRFVQRLKDELPSGLFGAEVIKIHYISTISSVSLDAAEIEASFGDRLRAARAGDQRIGFTSVGPHRDDLKLYADGKSLVDYGSAGQQRSCLLALYFAQMEVHQQEHGFYPAFLVDDVEAELDDQRLRVFLEYLSKRTQTFLTSTKDSLPTALLGPIQRYEVKDGRVVSS